MVLLYIISSRSLTGVYKAKDSQYKENFLIICGNTVKTKVMMNTGKGMYVEIGYLRRICTLNAIVSSF